MQLPAKFKDKNILTSIGMMSGTSMDGIDLALIKTDGLSFVEKGPTLEVAYSQDERSKIELSLKDATQIAEQTVIDRSSRPDSLADTEKLLTYLHAKAIERFLKVNDLNASQIDLIGFHGQTVLHRPDLGLTVQLGDGKQLANATGIATIYDMRAEDMVHGGQGAPLIPVYHQALSASLPDEHRANLPIAFVNIGGISNISYVGAENELIAFDTGPGNALIDQWVQGEADIAFDEGGEIAAKGKIDQKIADKYLSESFFKQSIPKSLDRNDFMPLIKGAASLEDGARTLAYITAASIIKSIDHLPQAPKLWIICGGGRKHPSIMSDLESFAQATGGAVMDADHLGLDGDAMEAEAWGYLAVRCVKNLPITFPQTTGCKAAVSGGVFVEPTSDA